MGNNGYSARLGGEVQTLNNMVTLKKMRGRKEGFTLQLRGGKTQLTAAFLKTDVTQK